MKKKQERKLIPWVTYTDPEIAHVGISEHEVREKVMIYKTYFSDNDRAVTEKDTKGFVKLITKPFSGKILGATIVGHNAGDLLAEITIAMKTNTSIKKISNTIHPYPTRSQLIRKAADKWYKEYLPGLFRK